MRKKSFTEFVFTLALIALMMYVSIKWIIGIVNEASRSTFMSSIKLTCKEVKQGYFAGELKNNYISSNDETAMEFSTKNIDYCIYLNNSGNIKYLWIKNKKYIFESFDAVEKYKIGDIREIQENEKIDFDCVKKIEQIQIKEEQSQQPVVGDDEIIIEEFR